ncbi:MAG: PQQ-binding-like beta-propeller repeat protein [Alphaproteobacteria bacterium]|nr:PQQ-binding-like beta-propeller repeat protein [Alphaproteobacteria bacterium]
MRLAFGLCALLVGASAAWADDAREWTSWGNGLSFDHFAPAGQITPANVAGLKPVWKFVIDQKGGWEITPLVVDGVMYIQDMQGTAYALDPETGREIWRHATGLRGRMRAVAFWRGDAGHAPRVIMAVQDRIYALDAASGKPVPGFGGDKGYINIRDGFAAPRDRYGLSSPPTVYKNLLITGPSTQEFGAHGPPGDPRAYDVVTGKLVWRFHTVPKPGERNFGSWGEGWKNRSGPSAWGMMSVDPALGLVYVPTGNPADSFIGVDRPGDNLYANSIIALDAKTGAYRWHFQTVHHDLFDYDNAAPPALVDLTVKGKKIPALVAVTKQGLMFILDRRTGKPVFGVEERPVPQSTIPGEQTSPTQPFPIKPPPLVKMGMTRADITTITKEAHDFCAAQWDRLGLKDSAPYTPPRLGGPNLFLPGNTGGLGGAWGGASVDPRSGTIFVNTNNLPAYSYIVPADPGDRLAAGGYKVDKAYTKLLDPKGLPCIQPPYAEMVAIDGHSGDIKWRRPLGSAEAYGPLGKDKGSPNLGGSLATGGGLVFIGATGLGYLGAAADQPVLRAYDAANGKEVWVARLSSPAEANPMSFVGKSGRQYVVVASSGAPRPDAQTALIAFALPRPGETIVDLQPAPVPTGREASSRATPVPVSLASVADLATGVGKDDVARVCSSCHAIGTAISQRREGPTWARTVEDMRARGAAMDDATAARIKTYLAAHYGLP